MSIRASTRSPILRPMPQFLPSKPYHLQPGSVVRQFEVLGVIGQGGFALTYLGADTSLEREVVIKEYFPSALAHRDPDGRTVLPRLEDEYMRGLEFFYQETQSLSQLQHPHIVDVLGVFQANDTAYMVMPFYAGEDLESWLRAQPGAMTEADAVNLLKPMMEALEYIHGEGIIHRDVKPANILMAQRGSRRYLVLLDFGGARQFVAGVTQTFDQILSPGYAPFEQYTRDGRQGPWTDVYACAAVLYRMTVGERPPDAAERKSGKQLDLSRASPAFAAVLATGLAESPDDRYQDIAAFERALVGAGMGNAGIASAGSPSATISPAAAGAAPTPARGAERSASAPPASPGGRAAWPLVALVAVVVLAGFAWWQFLRTPVLAAGTAAELERNVRTARDGSVIVVRGDLVLGDTLHVDRPMTLRGADDAPSGLRIRGGSSLIRFDGTGTLVVEGLSLSYEAVGSANGVEVAGGSLSMTSSSVRSVVPDTATPPGIGGHGVMLGTGATAARIIDVRFLDHLGSGLLASGAVTLEVERSVFSTKAYGMVLDGEVRAVLRANQFVENDVHGLEVRGRASVELQSDRFIDNGGFGVLARGATTINAQGVTLQGNHEGFVAEDDAAVSMRDATIAHNQVVGAHYRGDARGELRSNTVAGNRIGLVVEHGAAPSVIGNRFTNSTSAAVRRNCSVVMEDNTFEGNAVDVSGC